MSLGNIKHTTRRTRNVCLGTLKNNNKKKKTFFCKESLEIKKFCREFTNIRYLKKQTVF